MVIYFVPIPTPSSPSPPHPTVTHCPTTLHSQ